jgi:DNA-binding beta-propeller fold protein YncE
MVSQKGVARLLCALIVMGSLVGCTLPEEEESDTKTITSISNGSETVTFDSPEGVAFDSDGNIFVADTGNHRIVKLSAAGVFVQSFGSEGTGDEQFNKPMGIDIDTSGNVVVADSENDRIVRFDPDAFASSFESLGRVVSESPEPGNELGEFNLPVDVAIGAGNIIYVADLNNNRIQVVPEAMTSSGVSEWTAAAKGFAAIWGLEVVGDNIYASDKTEAESLVYKFSTVGSVVSTWGGEGSTSTKFRVPKGIAYDSDSGNLYICDAENGRLQITTTEGTFSDTFGSSGSSTDQFDDPTAIDINDDYIVVADTDNDRIQIITK